MYDQDVSALRKPCGQPVRPAVVDDATVEKEEDNSDNLKDNTGVRSDESAEGFVQGKVGFVLAA
jgi:hypothetical protein